MKMNQFDNPLLHAGLELWAKASDRNQKRAHARMQILDAVAAFIKEKGCTQTCGEEVVAQLYKERQLPSIEEGFYQIEPGLSVAKIRRLRSLYNSFGLPGLLVNYGRNKDRQRSISPDIRIFIIGCLKNKQGIRKSNIYKLIQKTFKPAPSRQSVGRFIDRWKSENLQLATMIENPGHWKNNMMAAFGNKAAGITHFCHTWEIDSTQADVITRDKQRCAIVGLIDVYSRRAKVFITPTSRSIAIAACIREALISWGIPDYIRMDNGKDYSSRHIKAITSSLRINTPKLPPYTPEAKPHIERFFGTYSRGLEELLPGYCGHSVAERQKTREQMTWSSKIMKPGDPVEIPLTMQELKTISDKWLKIYEMAPHKGLKGLSPHEASGYSTISPQKIRDERVLDILLAPISEPRKVGKKGISLDGSSFIAPELVEHVGRRVEARRDIQDAGLIYVFDATKKTFLCKARNEELTGQTLEEYNVEKKRNIRDIKEQSKALETLGLNTGSAFKILLGDELIRPPRKVTHLQSEADNQDIREARKAVNDNIESIQDAPKEPGEIIPLKSILGDPRDDSWMTANDLNKEFERAMENTQTKRARVQAGSFKG